ncbi:sarcoplasmic calcium-binding protein-like [Lingula anatina]|uniref:Sarcoplasmic calcium-binding protein-like n=1 Tax=Lingula anatina TaxID=7574 RepID=A0A1S3ILM2_LINAN|nr:sarcoplasmic calcium-binding protein-like [Lingula anatina]|eukprot:XP_013398983.1 sarcoplasmic calcium-binding protein-like [Lingula anatina]
MSCIAMLNMPRLIQRRLLGLPMIVQPDRKLGRLIPPAQNLSKKITVPVFNKQRGMAPVIQLKLGLVKQPWRFRKPVEYPEITGSDHWRRKMRTQFRALDTNGDGYLTKEDIEMGARRTAAYMNLSDENTEIILDQRLAYWRDSLSKGRISEDRFVDNQLVVMNDNNCREILFDSLCSRFRAMDLDGDGLISPDEHAAIFYSFNIPTEHSKKVFDIIDSDSDGFITQEEFVLALTEFNLTENPDNKFNECFGPLVDNEN